MQHRTATVTQATAAHRPGLWPMTLLLLQWQLVLACVSSSSHAVSPPAYDFTEATQLMASNLTHYGSAGVVALVEQQGRSILRYANAEGPPLIRLREDSVVAVASCTKWFSGAIVLALAERGYFALDDPLARYLPAFEVPTKRHITLRQCFAMTSGLSLRDPDYELDRTLTLAQSVDLIASNTPVVFPPGTMLDYEGDGMQVVGRIAEITTGRDWRELAREVLFEPLGMTTASYDVFGLNPAIAGGARCSATDYLKFLRMILRHGVTPEGRVVLSSRATQTFFTNQPAGLPERFTPGPESPFNPYGVRADYGMGSWIMADNPVSGVVEEVASPGAFGS
ncbi:MAG: beta-lactamase family protein, partial [Verrucomicrobiales bacterium]|nr:beta-lactamase family protein [Verrucomicrobiales bacterium]